jgi:hypothetical protein
MRIHSLADPVLQKYLYIAPGVGKSVIYVAVNVKDGKAYVGKHGHGRHGQSLNASRKSKHENPTASTNTYLANAMRKHGKASFEWFIIWHGDACNEDAQEQFWISPDGLHTVRDNGGWGYNLTTGGDGGKMSVSALVKHKASHNSQVYLDALSKRTLMQWQARSDQERADVGAKIKANRQAGYARRKENRRQMKTKIRHENKRKTADTKFELRLEGLASEEAERLKNLRTAQDRGIERKRRIKEAGRKATGDQLLTIGEAMKLLQAGAFEDPDSVGYKSAIERTTAKRRETCDAKFEEKIKDLSPIEQEKKRRRRDVVHRSLAKRCKN